MLTDNLINVLQRAQLAVARVSFPQSHVRDPSLSMDTTWLSVLLELHHQLYIMNEIHENERASRDCVRTGSSMK